MGFYKSPYNWVSYKTRKRAQIPGRYRSNLGTPHGVVLRFCWEPEVGPLPCAEGLGLVIIHFRWPGERHLNDVKYCSIPWRRWKRVWLWNRGKNTEVKKTWNLHVGAEGVTIGRQISVAICPIRRSAVNTCPVVVFVVWQVAVGIVSQTSAAAWLAGLVAYPKGRVPRLAILLPLPTCDAITHSQLSCDSIDITRNAYTLEISRWKANSIMSTLVPWNRQSADSQPTVPWCAGSEQGLCRWKKCSDDRDIFFMRSE